MSSSLQMMQRPRRWTEPFDPEMSSQAVESVLSMRPFSQMQRDRFPRNCTLEGIIQNDCRILNLTNGDIIVREGDYGSSAYLVMDGSVTVSLKSLPAEVLGRVEAKRKTLFESFAQLWTNARHAEVRQYQNNTQNSAVGQRDDGQGTRVFLHDIPRVIDPRSSAIISAGEIFGEQSALTRTPRSATVVANGDVVLLEIRWQGLRDLMKNDPALKSHVESLYRQNSLNAHLREVSLFKSLEGKQVSELNEKTEFVSFGKFQWNINYRSTKSKDVAKRILDEPVILKEGDYVNALYLIRNGFVRICRNHGDGIQTVAYMGKGGIFGLREIVHNWKTGTQSAWRLSLRAVGYVDVLRIPVEVIEQSVLSQLDAEQLPRTFDEPFKNDDNQERRGGSRQKEISRGLLEFLVEERFTNGSKAMMIDLNRCTRCDDCVRACASTHNNNPRFVRQGEVHENWMITNACMHCVDPVCMIGCPTGAIGRDHETGNVMINDNTCIGCSTCANSCPYSNIKMVEINDRRGNKIVDAESSEPILKATKCDFCTDQLAGPACQRACPHDALVRIDLTDPAPLAQWSL